MRDIIQQLIDNDFRDLRGMHVSGRVPVDTALINELIGRFLQPGGTPAGPEPAPTASAGPSPSPSPSTVPVTLPPDFDPLEFARRHLKRLQVGTEGDKIVVDFDLRVD